MSRPLDADISANVETARELVDKGETIAAAARAVGINAATLRYRLNRQTITKDTSNDALPELPPPHEIPIFVRDYTDQPKHYTYAIGDLHIGSPAHAADKLADWIGYLAATPYASMLNTGDNTNCALKDSVSDVYEERLTVRAARQEQTKVFKPLADKDQIDCVIDGNHEMRVYRAIGDSPNAQVCDALGINYSQAAAIVRYLVGDQQYDLYLRHGTGGGGRLGAQVNRLHDQDRIIDADIYVSGHTHTLQTFKVDTFRIAGTRKRPAVDRKTQTFICSGSFVGYEDYAATAGYQPTHIGAPRLRLDGKVHDVKVSV